MSEEVENTNDGTWSGLKKTIVGVAGTVVTAGGVWLTTLFGGGDAPEQAPVQQAAPVINLNLENNNNVKSGGNGGTTKVIERERVVEKPASSPVKKKDGDEFKEKPAEW